MAGSGMGKPGGGFFDNDEHRKRITDLEDKLNDVDSKIRKKRNDVRAKSGINDLRAIEEMFKSAGIDYELDGKDIKLNAHSNNVEGYGGFVAYIHFDKDGNLEKIGIWE